jgi:Lrp/AsnC family leucine-responsive transcriptional regulator
MRNVTEPHRRNRRVDAIDTRILRLLVRDGRASYTDLGAAVGLSANAVAQRIRRLEDARIVRGYQAVLDPAIDAAGVSAVVHLRTATDSDLDDLERRLSAMPEVTEILDLAGPADYEIRLRCADQPQLYDVVQVIRALPGVRATETRPVLREVMRR